MEVMFAICAGLDVHKKSIVACVLVSNSQSGVQRHIKTFQTTLAGLGSAGTMAIRLRCHPRGDGEHGGVLEAGVQRASARL